MSLPGLRGWTAVLLAVVGVAMGSLAVASWHHRA